MRNNEDNALAALGGGAITALVWWDRLDRRMQDRLDVARTDARDALGQIRSLMGSGDFVRLFLPIVRDMIVGVALGSAKQPIPQPIPSLPVPINRPNVSQENGAATYQWPPKAGTYDAQGNVESVGEVSPSFLALTYQEVRAAIVGISQKEPLSELGNRQVFRAFNQLVGVVGGLNLTIAEYADAWARLFTGATAQTLYDPHRDPTKSPTVMNLHPSIASVVALSSTQIPGYPFSNANTDAAMRFRVTTNAGVVNAGETIAAIRFGTEYRYRNSSGVSQALQPAVNVATIFNSGAAFTLIVPSNVTSQGFDLVAGGGMAANQTREFHATATAGQGNG